MKECATDVLGLMADLVLMVLMILMSVRFQRGLYG